MNYNHLYYFHVIAQEGSIARASKRLRVSQPTLSEQLKQLEMFFDTKLFDRKGGAMRLNNSGRRALTYTENIFDIADRLVSSFERAPEPPKVRLDIGVVTTCARSVVTERIVQLFKDETVIVRIRQGDNQYLLHELVSSGLDIVVTDTLPSQASDRGIDVRTISSPRLVIIGNSQRAAGLTENIPCSLHAQPFIHYTTQSSYRWEIDQYFRDHASEPSVVAEADDVYVIREAVRAGIGFGVVPQSMLDEFSLENRLVVLGEIDRNFDAYALISNKNPTDETLRALNVLVS